MARILIVHGIETNGDGDVEKFAPILEAEGHEVLKINHNVKWWNARFRSDNVADQIMGAHQKGDHVIAHSFGCLATYKATLMGARFDKVIFFSAAMGSRKKFPINGFNRLYNYANTKDIALSAGSLLLFHGFGTMGKCGYERKDDRVKNILISSTAGRFNHTAPWFNGDFPRFTDQVKRILV